MHSLLENPADFSDPLQQNRDLIALWGTRLLLELSTPKSRKQSAGCWGTIRLLGLNGFDTDTYSALRFKRGLKERRAELEHKQPWLDSPMRENIEALGDLIGLNQVEQEVLAFAMILHSHAGLDNLVDEVLGHNLTGPMVIHVLSVILDRPVQEIRGALHGHNLLARSGLVRLDKKETHCLTGKLDLLDGIQDEMNVPHENVLEILENHFRPTGPGSLSREDFEHVKNDYEMMAAYLARAVRMRLKGVNVLIYGRPGTGKTELSRTVAAELSCRLYEVAAENGDGDPVRGKQRFQCYQLSQKVLERQRDALIVFDEVESVFCEAGESLFGLTRPDYAFKAWINRILEENPVPTLWISNSLEGLDPAYVRRFDLVIHLDHPPGKTRARILHRCLEDLPVSEKWIRKVARNPDIAPAVMTRAARVVSHLDRRDGTDPETQLETLLGRTLKAMGYSSQVKRSDDGGLPYCPEAVNPDHDIDSLVEQLKLTPSARLCLYGPPGTGKTAFGRYVARQLEKPLVVKRASDLLSAYVGQTEQAIAAMFEEARGEEAVLMLDETDSFLRDRSQSRHGWEVTQVNELLTQMEDFGGLFICSTNLVDFLDAASLRRFDLKIKFDYLKADQAWRLFIQVLAEYGNDDPLPDFWKERVAGQRTLTPGDFATVVRKSRLLGQPLTPEILLEGLAAESSFRERDQSRGIGFTAGF